MWWQAILVLLVGVAIIVIVNKFILDKFKYDIDEWVRNEQKRRADAEVEKLKLWIKQNTPKKDNL